MRISDWSSDVCSSDLRLVHLRGEEAFDDGQLGAFGLGKLGAAALVELFYRFAALLRHFLKHVDDQRVIVGGPAAGAQFDVLVLDSCLNQADCGRTGLVARFHRLDKRGLYIVTDHDGPCNMWKEPV